MELADENLDDKYMEKFCEALKYNRTVLKINLSKNKKLTNLSGEYLLKALEKNEIIEEINIDDTNISKEFKNKVYSKCQSNLINVIIYNNSSAKY